MTVVVTVTVRKSDGLPKAWPTSFNTKTIIWLLDDKGVTVAALMVNNLRVPQQAVIKFSSSMGKKASKTNMPAKEQAPPERGETMVAPNIHRVTKNPTVPPFPEQMELAMFGLGCFWGAEKKFWQQSGVFSTQVGFAEGDDKDDAEVVRVVFDPAKISYGDLLKVFWESHDPTQGMRQGNDIGAEFRSAIYTYGDQQQQQAETSRDAYQKLLTESGHGKITTEISPAPEFYYAEDNHQQYLDKNPNGYCRLRGTGVACPIGLLKQKKDER